MKRMTSWIRIVCACILILGLLGCSGSCAKKANDPVPATAAPQNDEPGTVTEDEVITTNPNDGTETQPPVPEETEKPNETEAPVETNAPADTPAPDATEDPLEIEIPIETPTPKPSGATDAPATPTPKPTEPPTGDESPTPTPGAIELPDFP